MTFTMKEVQTVCCEPGCNEIVFAPKHMRNRTLCRRHKMEHKRQNKREYDRRKAAGIELETKCITILHDPDTIGAQTMSG